MVIKKKTGCGPPYFQLWQEKALEVRGDLIAIDTEERASWIYQEGVGGAVNIQLNGPQEKQKKEKIVTQAGGCPATGKTSWLTKSSY